MAATSTWYGLWANATQRRWRGTTTVTAAAAASNGLPSGGTTGQFLRKSSATDYATNWAFPEITDDTGVALDTELTLPDALVAFDFAGGAARFARRTVFALASHTHALTALTQSSAADTQVAGWSTSLNRWLAVDATRGKVVAVGLSTTDAAANTAALQEQWDDAALAGKDLIVPRRTGGGMWPVSPVDRDAGRWWAIGPTNPTLYYGLYFERDAGLYMADGTVADARTQNGIIRFNDHTGGGIVSGLHDGQPGRLSGNSANQPGLTGAQSSIAQGSFNDLIVFDGRQGVGCRNITVRNMWLGDTQNHGVNCINELYSGERNIHQNIRLHQLVVDKFGEALQTSDVYRQEWHDIEMVAYDGWAFGDGAEPATGDHFSMHNIFLRRPTLGGAACRTMGSVIDFAGARHGVASHIRADGCCWGFDVGSANNPHQCDDIVVSDFQLWDIALYCFGVSQLDGRVKFTDGIFSGTGGMINDVAVLHTPTFGEVELSNVEFRDVTRLRIDANAVGKWIFRDVVADGAQSGTTAFLDWNPSGGAFNIDWERVTVRGYDTAVRWLGSGTVIVPDVGNRMVDCDFSGCTARFTLGPGVTAALTTNLRIEGGLLGRRAYGPLDLERPTLSVTQTTGGNGDILGHGTALNVQAAASTNRGNQHQVVFSAAAGLAGYRQTTSWDGSATWLCLYDVAGTQCLQFQAFNGGLTITAPTWYAGNLTAGPSSGFGFANGFYAITEGNSFYVFGAENRTPLRVRQNSAGAQTEPLVRFDTSGGTQLAAIGPGGEFQPPSLADAAAATNSVYYSTTAGKLVYKDAGGTVNNLY